MPDFIYNNKVYYNPVEFAMDRTGGTWWIAACGKGCQANSKSKKACKKTLRASET